MSENEAPVDEMELAELVADLYESCFSDVNYCGECDDCDALDDEIDDLVELVQDDDD